MPLDEKDKAWIREQLDQVASKIEITETNLLGAFHDWASPTIARQRSHSAALRALDLEMEALDKRVGELEAGA